MLDALHLSVTLAPANDSRWFRAYFDAHATYVRSAVLRLGGPSADADDLLQQVFLIAHRRWPALEGSCEPKAWLYGVAYRVVSQARRRARLRSFFGLDDIPELRSEETPASAFERREASARVYRILDRLPEKQRTVLILFELEGLSGEEVAAVVGCPLKTVWTRLFHGRQKFEKAWRQAEAREGRER